MCGIIGYIGKKSAFPALLSGLKRMEYRGYDSYGFCVFNEPDNPFVHKKAGKISEAENGLLDFNVKGNIGQAHTRWATTGGITDQNAHPHTDCKNDIFLVHNGIIENYRQIKDKLVQEGHKFSSETDTEVLAHLVEKYMNGSLEEALTRALSLVRGTYGIVAMSRQDPEKIVAARLSSPIVLGIGETELVVASDPAAVITHTREVINLDDNEIAVLTPNDFAIIKGKALLKKPTISLDWTPEQAEKQGYDHFMLKEIMESPSVIRNAIVGRLIPGQGMVKLGGLDYVTSRIKNINKLVLVACGTANYAARIGKYMLEEYAGIPTEVDIGSEFRYRKPMVGRRTAAIFVSQSGETADTLAGLREMSNKGLLTLGITNVVGSTQARETDAGIYTRSGPEIAVASTKAFLGQLTTLAMLAIYLGRERNLSIVKGKRIVGDLANLPELSKKVLKLAPQIEQLVQKYKGYKNFWFIGRKYNFPIALEGALKLKEISYSHSEGVAGGELKHGPLALVDENFPTIALCPQDSVYEKMLSNIEQVKARGGPVIAIASEGDERIKELADDVIYIPKTMEMLTPIISVTPLHLFAYYMAKALGHNIDKPRNLAKSVTVE
jgi:glucosamine--fructose-6-phosphate aminotransferase (isomerizing)